MAEVGGAASLASSLMSHGLAEDCGAERSRWEGENREPGRIQVPVQELRGTGRVSVHLFELELAEQGEVAEGARPPMCDGA